MRINHKDLHPIARKLNFWLWDGQYDLREKNTLLARIVNKIDPEWELQSKYIEDPGHKLLCLIRGHMPEDDQCMKPAHRYCLLCGRPTPNAPVRYYRSYLTRNWTSAGPDMRKPRGGNTNAAG